MLFKLFLAFTLIPALELFLLIKLGSALGVWTTLGLVIITGFAGAALARVQGLKTMLRIRDTVQQGIAPTEELIGAVLIFTAGAVLLTPGFLTDIFGLLLLYPPTRNFFIQYARRRFEGVARHRQYPPPRNQA